MTNASAKRPAAAGSSARLFPPSTLPFVGRDAEREALARCLDAAERSHGATLFLAGEGGIGKTRLAQSIAEDAERREFTIAVGRAYPVETGVPYALFSDAFLPLLRGLDPSTLAVLSRGGEAELAHLFPALGTRSDAARALTRGQPPEFKARLLWNFTQFLARFSAKSPLLIILENVQWADASSLELLHFVARQIGEQRIMLLCSYNDTEREANPLLRTTERSLVSLGVATTRRLAPLTREESVEVVRRTFGIEPSAVRAFSDLLFERTRGNPFFIEEMLKSLVESGRLTERDGRWTGWNIDELDLPRTVTDAIIARLDRLSAGARAVADLAAVIGTRARLEVLQAVSGLPSTDLLAAVDELRKDRVLNEDDESEAIVYDFGHPSLQATLYTQLGRARARALHATVAEALEALYHGDSEVHADELAFHFARADTRDAAPKATRYLAAAGRSALAKYATREAVSYLSAALELHDRAAAGGGGLFESNELIALLEDLARAQQRNGEYDAARGLSTRAREAASRAGDHARVAALERRMGLASYWSGRHDQALAHYEAGLQAAARAGDRSLVARVQLAKGMCLQELGRPADAQRELADALAAAEVTADGALLARVHRGLMLVYTWTGPADLARMHGERAIEYARSAGQRGVEWSAHWAMALLAGLTGVAADVARHVAEAERLAEALRSPVLGVWTAEVSIEYASAIGDWDTGLALAERTIPVARALRQRTLLPRLLVWTGLMHLGRGDLEKAKDYFDESWTLSGAGSTDQTHVDVHTVVPAHTGLASYYLALQDYRRAIEIGEAGLAIADRSGYVVWTIHRLLPVVIEAALWMYDFERAERYGERLRRDSEKLGHKLGLAWATSCDALVVRLKDRDIKRAISMLRHAADELDAVPFAVDASRMRRNVAQLMRDDGDREGAMRELRRAHDVFARIGAERELRMTRDALRELGARPPARAAGEGAGALTGREREIALMVADRKSNKEIGAALDISARTVSTHLSNIFAKLGVASRGELTDLVRRDDALRV